MKLGSLRFLERMRNLMKSQRLFRILYRAVKSIWNSCWSTSQIRDFLVEYVFVWPVCTTDLPVGHMFSHENILFIGRVAEAQVVKELIGTRHRPEASLAVDRLYEVRSHLGVVTWQSFCSVKFTTQNTLQENKNKMRNHRNNNATLNLIDEIGVHTLEMGNVYYVYLLDAPFCNILGKKSHRYCRLVWGLWSCAREWKQRSFLECSKCWLLGHEKVVVYFRVLQSLLRVATFLTP